MALCFVTVLRSTTAAHSLTLDSGCLYVNTPVPAFQCVYFVGLTAWRTQLTVEEENAVCLKPVEIPMRRVVTERLLPRVAPCDRPAVCVQRSQHVNDRTVFLCFCRSISPHSLRRLPHPAFHALWGCPLPAPPAGCPQTPSDRRTQPSSRSGLLPPSATHVHEYEHELHRLLSQVSTLTTKWFLPSALLLNLLKLSLSLLPALQSLLPPLGTLPPRRGRWQQR